MGRGDDLRGRTDDALERGGDTNRLATEWAMPFIADDSGPNPTDVPFRGGGYGGGGQSRQVSGFVAFSGRLLLIFGLLVLLGGVYGGLSMRSETVSAAPKIQEIAVPAANPTVRIENGFGEVRVLAGLGDKVIVSSTTSVRHVSRGLAREALAEYQPEISAPSSGPIVIRTRQGDEFDGGDFIAGWLTQRSVDLTVTMPANGNLDVEVSAGSMRIEGISGKITAVVNAGGLEIRDSKLADGSSITVNAGHADFNGELLRDASLDVMVHAGHAEVILPRTTAARLQAVANAGNVSATGWPIEFPHSKGNGERISGFLTADTATKSVITVTVNAGNASIVGRSEGSPPSPPAAPSAPVGPSAPPRR